MAIQVFIVDDHYMVVEGIRSLLQNAAGIDCCGHASNAASCLAFLKQHQPDIILMDINLPDMSGIDLCKEVLTLYPSVFVIGLSTFNQLSIITRMMEQGASGYLLKNVNAHELSDAIYAVVKGKQFLSHDAAVAMRPPTDSILPIVTRREREVMQCIAEGLTNAEIAEKLFVSVTTVDSHRKNLLNKLHAKNTASLVKIAMDSGLIT